MCIKAFKKKTIQNGKKKQQIINQKVLDSLSLKKELHVHLQ